MKVMLNGATAGTNFGDFLFAKMFQDFVAERVGRENVYWYRTKYAMSSFFDERLHNHNMDDVKNMDAMIYISGGYFCGDDKNLRDYILRILRYFILGMQCIWYKIPYSIVGLEVAEPKNKILKYIEKKILKNANLIVVRNQESLDCLHSYGIENGIQSVDSAFVIEPSFFEKTEIPHEIENCGKKTLFFHIHPSISANEVLKEKVIPIVNAFLKQHPEYAVIVATDQFSPSQADIVADMCEEIVCEQKIKYFYDDPIALCKVLSCVDTIVTPKLHVGIVGAALGKSVISFSGHTEKIQRLYSQLGEAERSTALSTLETEHGIDMLEKYYDKPIHIKESFVQQAKNNFLILDNFLQEVERNTTV